MRPSKWIARLEDRAIAFYEKNKDRLPRYILIALILLYAAGFIIHSAVTGLNNVWRGGDEPLFTLNPVKNIASVFTSQGFGIIIFSVLMYCLFTGKGKDIISGYKTVKDKKRGIEILPEGTHGTSGFMDKKELPEFLYSGSLKKLKNRPLRNIPYSLKYPWTVRRKKRRTASIYRAELIAGALKY